MICKDYWNRYKQGFLDITEARSFKVCVMTCVTAFHEPCLLILVPMTITNFQNFQHLKESVLLSILGEFFCPFILSKTAIKQKQTKNKCLKKKKADGLNPVSNSESLQHKTRRQNYNTTEESQGLFTGRYYWLEFYLQVKQIFKKQ